jgi:hypothetical protein
MKRDWPKWTLIALGGVVAFDVMVILLSKGPLACGSDGGNGSDLAALFALVALILMVAGPSTLIVVGLREALTHRPVPVYALITIGVPVIIALSGWTIGSAWGATGCDGSLMIMGG